MNLEVLRPWIDRKLVEIVELEDEIVSGLIISELEKADEKGPNPKKLEITLEGIFELMKGFLGIKTRQFVHELWKILLEAQTSENGVVD